MEQNTSAWLEYRKNKIGSSDAPIILGLSEYKTPYQLWLEKSGLIELENKSNYVQDLGHRFEPRMRGDINLKYDLELLPLVCEHQNYSYLCASLDGADMDKDTFAEIKYVGKVKMSELRKKRKPPIDHVAQVQHQFMVTGLKKCYYGAYVLNDAKSDIVDTEVLEMRPSIKYIEKMLPILEKFWAQVKSGEPPELGPKDVITIKNESAEKIARDYFLATEELKIKELAAEKLKEQFIELMKHDKALQTRCGNFSLTKHFRKGNVDYAKIPQIKDIDLEGFRKKPSSYYKVGKIV